MNRGGDSPTPNPVAQPSAVARFAWERRCRAKGAAMNKLGWAVVATVASAVLFFFGTGLDPVPELAWVAPLPILLLAPRVSGAAALACAFAAYLAGSTGSWSYFWHSLAVPRPAALAILGGSALLFALSTGLFRLLVRRGNRFLAALAAP